MFYKHYSKIGADCYQVTLPELKRKRSVLSDDDSCQVLELFILTLHSSGRRHRNSHLEEKEEAKLFDVNDEDCLSAPREDSPNWANLDLG
jgi:hypothetical protein